MLHDQALAEDVLVDTFLRVQDRRATYKSGMKFTTWLYTIAYHLATDRLRRAGAQRATGAAARGR